MCNRPVENTYSLLLEKIFSSCLLATERQPQASPPHCARACVCVFFMADTFCMSPRSKLGKVSSARLLQHTLAHTLKSQVCCISTLLCQELWCQASYLKQNTGIYINLLFIEIFGTDHKARCNVALIHTKLSKGSWLLNIKEFNVPYKNTLKLA